MLIGLPTSYSGLPLCETSPPMKKEYFLFFLPLNFIIQLAENETMAQDPLKTYKTTRIVIAPKIDGLLDEEVWKNAESVSDFIQSSPNEGGTPTQKTEVKVVYDNFAVYVGAIMF